MQAVAEESACFRWLSSKTASDIKNIGCGTLYLHSGIFWTIVIVMFEMQNERTSCYWKMSWENRGFLTWSYYRKNYASIVKKFFFNSLIYYMVSISFARWRFYCMNLFYITKSSPKSNLSILCQKYVNPFLDKSR